jgi:membrane-associated phospholipid phosphatase
MMTDCDSERTGVGRFQAWLISLVGTALLVVVAYEWADRPAAFFAHDHLAQVVVFQQVTKVTGFLFAAAAVIFVVVGILVMLGSALSRWQAALLLCSLSLVVAETVKEQLKYVFGRTWPDTWINGNPSLIHDGVFGFNPFHGGVAYSSFPSGHTTAICAVMSVLWLFYPKLRVLYILAVLAVAVALVGADYHFVSDVIAGGFVGSSTGWLTVVVWRRRAAAAGEPGA